MKVRDYFDMHAAEVDSLTWDADTAPWADRAWRVIESEIGPATAKLIVDLGSGTGRSIQNLAKRTKDARFLGVDFSDEMVKQAKQKTYGEIEIDFLVSRIDNLKLGRGTVDFFVSFGAFHHLKNKKRILANVFQMLGQGGKLINADLFRCGDRYAAELAELRQSDPIAAAENDRIRAEFQWIYDRDRQHPREFHTDPYEFSGLLEEAGFCSTKVYPTLQPGFAVVVGIKG